MNFVVISLVTMVIVLYCRVMAVPATVVYFTCYEFCRYKFGYHGGLEGNDWWKPMLAGATARSLYQFFKRLQKFCGRIMLWACRRLHCCP